MRKEETELLNGSATYQISIRLSKTEKIRLERLKQSHYLSAHAVLSAGLDMLEKKFGKGGSAR